MRRFLEVIWVLSKLAAIAGLIFLGSCTTTRTILKQAPTDLPSDWSPRAYDLLPEAEAKALLEATYYGPIERAHTVSIQSFDVIDDAAIGGKATLSQWRLDVTFRAVTRPLDLVVLIPKDSPNVPVILSQNFCPNHNVIPFEGVRAPSEMGFDCGGGGFASWAMKNVFGRYIVTPPLEDIMDRGYGFAAIYPSQYVPDSGQSGLNVLQQMFPDSDNQPGALSIWASLFPAMANVIEAEYGQRPIIAYGHSRFGKTALIAGAWFEEIDAVIAHQSGTLGASAMDDADGEPLSSLVEGYPHWPGSGTERFANRPSSLPVRPADLLAQTGDKPVLLGNARRDVWSDPFGAFAEGKIAWPEAFSAEDPSDFRPMDPKAYWLRPGTHGVVKEDWPAFLDFLDAQALE